MSTATCITVLFYYGFYCMGCSDVKALVSRKLNALSLRVNPVSN